MSGGPEGASRAARSRRSPWSSPACTCARARPSIRVDAGSPSPKVFGVLLTVKRPGVAPLEHAVIPRRRSIGGHASRYCERRRRPLYRRRPNPHLPPLPMPGPGAPGRQQTMSRTTARLPHRSAACSVYESDSAGPLADRRESDDRQTPRGRTVGAGVAPAFMPKRHSELSGNRRRRLDNAVRPEIGYLWVPGLGAARVAL